jgi:RimJ/RimL family protein N-acetyltransferase
MYGPVIEGERVRLEPPSPAHAPTYLRWFADPVVTRYLIARHPTSLRREEKWIERMAASPDDVFWAMARAGAAQPIGTIHLKGITWRHLHAELGYVIGERGHWGKGCATDAVRLATAYAFLELGLQKVWATVMAPNEASRRALEKNGYRQCGLFRRDRYADGTWHDLWVGEILKDEWHTHQESGR